MVGAVAKVVEATFCVGEETARSGAHAIAIGAFDDMGCSRKGGTAHEVVLGTGPETEDDEIGMMILPPKGVSNVLLRNTKNRIIWNV